MTAIFALLVLPQPASFEYDLWKIAAEYAAIPIALYVFRHAFKSRSSINNKAVQDLTTGMATAQAAITKLQSADEMMEYRLNQEVQDRRTLEKEFREHKEKVLIGSYTGAKRTRDE